MSHFKEREEKICLNCGTELTDRYCPHCGQQNVEPKETFGHLLRHFLEDLTHFDGKFFTTMKYLLIRPGFLTDEYIRGKRMSYLNPIRMLLFISTIFFLLKMSVFNHNDLFNNGTINFQSDTIQHSGLKTTVGKKTISAGAYLDSIGKHLSTSKRAYLDSIVKHIDTSKRADLDSIVKHLDTSKHEFEPTTLAQYDSQQRALPEDERDDAFSRAITEKAIKFKNTKHDEGWEHEIEAKFYHMLPYILFLSIPLLALLFKLVYIRRKQFYYVAHAIFVVHYFCLVYLILIVKGFCEMGGSWWKTVSMFLVIIYTVYLYIAMLNFYKQRCGKTLIKYFIILCFGGMIVAILFVTALAISFWETA